MVSELSHCTTQEFHDVIYVYELLVDNKIIIFSSGHFNWNEGRVWDEFNELKRNVKLNCLVYHTSIDFCAQLKDTDNKSINLVS